MSARIVPLHEAEYEEPRRGKVIKVPAGTRVALPPGNWVAVITSAGILCDCGKGVFCPENPQERIEP